ncbi:HET-domain-containing protein [Cadophora sp. DSE1049]|nr:HET-domain-containing protein [Cadophora sp. DSE1049]
MTFHVYTPIDSTKSEIRILRIQPAKKESDEIQCDLVHSFLDKSPKYEALSYTRGGPAPDPGQYILLSSQRFPVFENLFAALVRLRHTSKPRTIWIDAICINQGEAPEAIREREQQITLMRRIYEQAHQVVIWLGDTGIGERIAMQSLLHSPRGFLSGSKNIDVEKKFGLEKGFRWWRRVWIIQEVALARKAIIMCGPDEASWEAIAQRLQDASDNQTLDIVPDYSTSTSKVRLPHGWERGQNGSRFEFYNHLSGECQETSPLAGQPPAPPQHMDHWRSLPFGWTKAWDNLGNTKFVFNHGGSEPVQVNDPEMELKPGKYLQWHLFLAVRMKIWEVGTTLTGEHISLIMSALEARQTRTKSALRHGRTVRHGLPKLRRNLATRFVGAGESPGIDQQKALF